MSLPHWKKLLGGNEANVVVSRANPLPVQILNPEDGDDDPGLVRIDQSLWLPPVAGQTITRLVQVPGIGAASAYAAGDAFGTLITFPNVFREGKWSGLVMGAFLLDLDDEGIQVDVPLFINPITATADNSALAFSDADLLSFRWAFSISTFFNWANNQGGISTGSPMHIVAGGPHLYTQLCVQGAANIAAGALPYVGLIVVPD